MIRHSYTAQNGRSDIDNMAGISPKRFRVDGKLSDSIGCIFVGLREVFNNDIVILFRYLLGCSPLYKKGFQRFMLKDIAEIH